jgi:predicted nucleic acid-binding protein
MNKLVFDSDGIIKLTKAGCLEKVLQNFDCYITQEVYEETVVKGKERLHDDAFLLDTFVNEGKLKLREAEPNEDAQFILSNSTVGRGESSTLHLFSDNNAKAIISDDRVFLNLLHRNNVRFIIPTDLIVRLYELKILTKKESKEALTMIKPMTNKNNFDKAIKNLED